MVTTQFLSNHPQDESVNQVVQQSFQEVLNCQIVMLLQKCEQAKVPKDSQYKTCRLLYKLFTGLPNLMVDNYYCKNYTYGCLKIVLRNTFILETLPMSCLVAKMNSLSQNFICSLENLLINIMPYHCIIVQSPYEYLESLISQQIGQSFNYKLIYILDLALAITDSYRFSAIDLFKASIVFVLQTNVTINESLISQVSLSNEGEFILQKIKVAYYETIGDLQSQ